MIEERTIGNDSPIVFWIFIAVFLLVFSPVFLWIWDYISGKFKNWNNNNNHKSKT